MDNDSTAPKPPARLSAPVPPAPQTAAATEPLPEAETAETPKNPRLDPTRYGDWELNGKCVDF